MTDKQDAHSGCFSLPGWRIVEAEGRDAATFLQAQSMNDVGALSAAHWQWNGWLNPKGRVIALFALAALDAQRYWLIVPDFPAEELVERLQRYVFRSKLSLRVREDLRVCGEFAPPRQARASGIAHTVDADGETVELDWSADGGARTLRISTRDIAEDHAPRDDAVPAVARWNAFDLAHGLPRLSSGQSEQWTPQMLSLDRLRAYSLKKGCYPGQEIVARTHYLGQAKRALARIGGGEFAVGAEIVADSRTIGSVACATGDEALAVLSADRPGDGWTCAGEACRELPLLDGLAR